MTLLDAAQGLTETISARAAETEAARRVPVDLAKALGDIGTYRMYVPKSLGGAEVSPSEAFEVVEALCRADGSTGWTAMILNTSFFACWLDPAVAKAILGMSPGGGMAGVFGPLGRATAEAGPAFLLTGRWPFNSGSPHVDWFCEGAFVTDDSGAPRTSPTGLPDWRFMFLPLSDVEVEDNWRVAGLRGTASNDVVIDRALVPEERTVNPIFATAPQDAPHFRWTFFALLASLMAGFPLGVGRRALDEFVETAGTKSRGGGPVLADTETVAIAVARCDLALRAARALVVDSIEQGWQRALAGDPLTLDQRIAIKGAAIHAMTVGIQVVDTLFAKAGGSALFDDNVLQRCWRDMHAASHHIFYSEPHIERLGKVMLDRPADQWMI